MKEVCILSEYSAIYRDYRPERFEDVIGQDAIVRILKNQIRTGQIGHAYLFSGLRGTGKTTTARIFAKAVNCENGGVEPCCTCSACQDIKRGTFMDVVEMDAASNNGVDDIRSLREELNYPPVRAKKKIYIIDEVHMLSTSAANAFLKVLEEPPEYVIFILATTDPQKLPKTILSRCTRLDFRRVSEEDIIKNMMEICKARGMEAEPEALAAIAQKADGSVRDSLSILEQCMFSNDTVILEKEVNEIIGIAGRSALIDLTARVMEGQISETLLLLDKMLKNGIDAKDLLRQWLVHFRNLLLAKFSADPARALEMSEENINRLRLQASSVTSEFINRAIAELTKTIGDSKTSENSRVLLEMCAVKLALPQETEDQFRFRQDKAVSFVEAYAEALARAGESRAAGTGRSEISASGTGAGRSEVSAQGADSGQGEISAQGADSGQGEISAQGAGSGRSEISAQGAGAVKNEASGLDSVDEALSRNEEFVQNAETCQGVDLNRAADAGRGEGTNLDEASASGAGAGQSEVSASGAGAGQSEISTQGADAGQGEALASGGISDEDLHDLWLTAVKKAAAEKMLLARIETRSRPVFINDGCIYVVVNDPHTEKALFEKGKDLIEQKLEMYYGTHLSIVKCAPEDEETAAKRAESAQMSVGQGINNEDRSVGASGSENSSFSQARHVAEQINEKFHLMPEIIHETNGGK